MKLLWKPIKGVFIRRLNRFVGVVEIDGKIHKVHIHDPGRLTELLYFGAEVLVREHQSPNRRTDYYLLAVRHGDLWVLVDSSLHSKIVEEAIKENLIAELEGYAILKREFKLKGSRIDFLLQSPSGFKALMEVKGCTLVKDGLALFPDAPTSRGYKHVLHLIDAVKRGFKSMIMFLIMREDAEFFMPNWDTDPKFSKALLNAHNCGVTILAYVASLSVPFLEVRVKRPVKVLLNAKL